MKTKSEQKVLRPVHIPMRSCIACRENKPKKDLIRLACKDGVVEVDTHGKKTGRGVYLCPFSGCWETGLKGNRPEHALKTSMTLENRTTLLQYGKSLPEKGKTRDE